MKAKPSKSINRANCASLKPSTIRLFQYYLLPVTTKRRASPFRAPDNITTKKSRCVLRFHVQFLPGDRPWKIASKKSFKDRKGSRSYNVKCEDGKSPPHPPTKKRKITMTCQAYQLIIRGNRPEY